MGRVARKHPIVQSGMTRLLTMLAGLLAAVTTLPAQAQPSANWPQPSKLLEQLEALTQQPLTSAWARTAEQLVLVIGDQSQDTRQRLNSLNELVKQRDELASMYNRLRGTVPANPELTGLTSELVRMHYRLSRRIDVWNALLKMPVRESLGDQSATIPGRLSFDQLPEQWVEYLRLNELDDAFFSAESNPEQRRETARRVLARVHSPILSDEQFEFVIRAIDPQVMAVLRDHASEPVDSSDLIKRMEYYESDTSARASYYLNERYQDLLWSDSEEDQAVAAALDAHYRNANFRLAISKHFMNRLLPELPTIAEPVSETVQGAQVSGQSQVSNEIQVNLIPDPERLNFQILTDGHVLSDTVARTKTFRILNQGQAHFRVSKQITVDRDGIDNSHEAQATSSANQFLVGVQSKLDNVPMLGTIARKMAEKKVREQTPETNQLFRRKVARSAAIRVEEELSKQITKVEQAAAENLMQPLLALELDPEPVQMATSDEQIVMRYRLAGRDQMAANTARPQDGGKSLVSFQIHQSLINNSISRLGLNGETFNSVTLAAHLQDKLGLEQKGPRETDDQEARDAEFTFDRFDPIRLDFEEDRLKITLNFTKLKINEKQQLNKASMTAAYRIDVQGMQVRLVQDDRGTVLGGRRLGEKMMISTVMKVLFDREYQFNALPQRFRGNEQAQKLAISQLVVSDGWIGVSMDDPQSVRYAQAGGPDDDPEHPRIGGNLRKLLDRR